MCVDLHLHSLYSDGTATPRELAIQARDNGLSCVALTDHDTIEGTGEFMDQGRILGLPVITGLEISAVHRHYSLHILGYGIDHNMAELHQWLAELQTGRTLRNDRIIARLQDLGVNITTEELNTLSACGQAGRPHIARLLVDKGLVDSMGEAFNRYLRKGAPAWSKRFSYSAAETIDMIHRAGGVAVLAHPATLDPELRFLPLLIFELVERGLDGIEVYYPSQSATVRNRLLQIAKKYKLVVTGGSDYHGRNRNHSAMAGTSSGFCPPDSLLPALRERIGNLND